MSASRRRLADPNDATARFCLRTGAQTGRTLHTGIDALSEACSFSRRNGGCLAIELMPTDLHDPCLLARVGLALQAAALPPSQLELAIAETVLNQAGLESLLFLSALRDLGVGLAMARFGSGDTSLSLLRRLPLTVLQLDPMLIADITHMPQDAAILRAVIQAGHAFDLTIVADGIETPAQAALLEASGCDMGQGPLWR